MSVDIKIAPLAALGTRELDGLCDVLMDCVDGGASVGFMWPMTREKAADFWRAAAASAQRGSRVILLADVAGEIVGTVSVVWAAAENQPHRADVAKMLMHRRARRKGVGAALLQAAEQTAREAGRSVLVLDTASADAERLYARQNWVRCGVIPRYALMPDGAFCSTTMFYKVLSA